MGSLNGRVLILFNLTGVPQSWTLQLCLQHREKSPPYIGPKGWLSRSVWEQIIEGENFLVILKSYHKRWVSASHFGSGDSSTLYSSSYILICLSNIQGSKMELKLNELTICFSQELLSNLFQMFLPLMLMGWKAIKL